MRINAPNSFLVIGFRIFVINVSNIADNGIPSQNKNVVFTGKLDDGSGTNNRNSDNVINLKNKLIKSPYCNLKIRIIRKSRQNTIEIKKILIRNVVVNIGIPPMEYI